MATVQARRAFDATGRPVTFVNPSGRIQRSEVFLHNPRIATSANQTGALRLLNCSGHRPYIAHKGAERWIWQAWPFAGEPGEIYLTQDERCRYPQASRMLMIEPHTKIPDGNKAWPWNRWAALVAATPHLRWIQPARPGQRALPGVVSVRTETFREALALLWQCRGFVGTEGALHHAAAALSRPAVVLWSEFIAPEFTGYAEQINLRHAGRACGSRAPCAGCRASMEAISVDEVAAAAEQMTC